MSLLDQLEDIHQPLLRPTGGCHNCPRHRVDFVPATLPTAKILWIGEAPGATEVKDGKGFTGKAGVLMRTHAGEVGLEVEAVTNVVKCRPPNNATPKAKEIERCLSMFLLDEVREYPILALCGSVPVKALFPNGTASHFRGNVAHHPDFPKQRFYSLYHPAYILRRPDLLDGFKKQLERLYRIAHAGLTSPPWQLVQGGGDAYWAALDATLAAPLISLDIETNKLESWRVQSRMRSIALTADEQTVVFAHEGEPHFLQTLHRIRTYLQQPGKSVVGTHIGFDLEWLERDLEFTVQCLGVHDVPLIYYQAKQYKQPSLKELASRELDGYRYLVYDPSREQDLVLLGNYQAEDVIYPLQLFRKGIAMLKPRTQDLVSRVLGPSDLVFQRMHTAGLYVRQEYRQQKIDEYEARRRAAIAAWEAEDPRFIPKKHESDKGLHYYLFQLCGLPADAKTEKGDPSTDHAAIKQWIRGGATYLKHLLVVRKCDKILSTYLTAYDKFIGRDSRVHSNFTLAYVDSGRPSSRQPNLFNIPRESEIKDQFGAAPGSVLVEADLSQIEFRIMVCLSQDQTGIAAYLRGEDAHTITARNFAPEPTSEQRSQAKPINFALCYGGNEYNVQSVAFNDYGLDWSIRQCKKFTDIFFNTYTRFQPFHEECKTKLVYNRGWFESVVGHIFHYRDWNSTERKRQDHAFRAALNSEAQGPAVHICFLIMVHASRLLRERKIVHSIVNSVYDSILIEVTDPKTVPDVIQTIQDAKALAYEWVKSWFIVPLELDYAVGESWGSVEDYALR